MISLSISSISDFCRNLEDRGKLRATVSGYSYDITAFMNWLLKHKSHLSVDSAQDIYAYVEYLEQVEQISENSIRRKIIAIKIFFRYIIVSNKLSVDSPASSVVIPPRDESLPEILSDEDVDHLLSYATLNHSWYRRFRDPAMISLFAFEGIKVNEMTLLTWACWYSLEKKQNISTLKIPGNKQRSITLSKRSTQYLWQLKQQINEHAAYASAEDTSKLFLFHNIPGRSDIPHIFHPISRHGIKFLLYEIGTCIHQPKLNSELLRHHAINYLLRSGKTPQQIQQHLGLKKPGSIIKHLHYHNSQHNIPISNKAL